MSRSVALPPRPVPDAAPRFVPPVPVVSRVSDLEVVAVDVPGDGFVDVRLLWPRGWSHEPDGLDGVTELATGLLGVATADRDPYRFACAAEALGAVIRSRAAAECFTIELDVVRDRLEPALALLVEVVTRPDLSRDRVERVRAEAIDQRRRQLADPTARASEVLTQRMFPGSRPGRPRSGSTGDLAARTPVQIATYVRGALQDVRPTVLVTGDLAALDVQGLADTVAGAFAGAADASAPRVATAPPPEAGIVLVDRPGAVQSALALGHPAPVRRHPDHAALHLGIWLLGGAFHSRLNLRLREERGFTYGARALQVARRDTGAIVLRTAVATDTTADSLRDIDAVLARLLVYGAAQAELDDARDALLRRAPQRFETVSKTADALAATLAHGLPPHDLAALETELPHVTLEQVDDALRRHLRRDDLTTVVVGDAHRLQDELEAADLGTVTVVRDLPD